MDDFSMIKLLARQSVTPTTLPSGRHHSAPALSKLCGLLMALSAPAVSHAVEFGPNGMFSLTGFAEVSQTQVNNQCSPCQRDPDTDRQRVWTDAVVVGAPLNTTGVFFTQIQPYLGMKYDLGRGFKLNGLLSQRWRDGKTDVKGFWYEKNLGISHEDYGSLTLGHMTTRAWSMTDYPYVSPYGLSNAFANTGAGYGMLTQAIRYTSRPFDVAQGDLVLEGTYDRGDTAFQVNKPRFVEVWAHYGKGDLVLDAMLQDAVNGGSVAWGHAPFKGPSSNPAYDAKLGRSSQSMALLLGRYKVDTRLELTGGVRRNQWSGAYAVQTDAATQQWNSMFNVNWGGTLNGVANPGYSATSTDWMVGANYRYQKWLFSTGMAYLGEAKTANPMERGQSNAALVNTARVAYEYGNGLQLYAQAGMVHFKEKGLAPLSMPSNAAIENIDSRTTKAGNWFAIGAVYTF